MASPPKKVKERVFDPTGRKHYKIALHVTNPLGAASKIGGGLEFRKNNNATILTYKMFYGAFKGKQYGIELEHFFNNKRPHQYFIYVKGIVGDTTRFVNTALSPFGHTQKIEVGPETYIGAGLGVGRRYNFNSFFVDWQLGLKYCILSGDMDVYDSEYEKARQSMFRLFRFTGPGSIIDAHLTLGIQL
jgi:hypothetical protein